MDITMTTNSYGGITRIRFIGYNCSRTLAAPLCVLLVQMYEIFLYLCTIKQKNIHFNMAASNFVDYVKIFCRSGKGGAGSMHLHRAKYVPKGGPDGGDGGGNRHPNRMIHMSCRRLVLLLLRGVSSYECEQLLPSYTITLVPPVKIIFQDEKL